MASDVAERGSLDAPSAGIAREVETPGGCVRLRTAADADAAFLFNLFRATRGGVLGGLPDAMVDSLLTMQYRARSQGYRDRFPGARRLVAETSDGPIGELIEHDEPDAVYIVDIALLPDQQQRGIGNALVRSVMAEAAARGGVRALVVTTNEASLRMFRRLGFRETGWNDGVHLELRWTPSDGVTG